MILRGYRKDSEGVSQLVDIIDIVEFTYSGKDMGERSISATINSPSPIDFMAGDFIELQMQSLVRGVGLEGSTDLFERFYLYTMPTAKKTARAFSHGTAFEYSITLYPAQYELGLVQMRDLGNANADSVIYTGFDNVSFYGGAKELMDRIMLVLNEAYKDENGNPLWSYKIANSVNEEINTSLERFPLVFSANTVMDAIMKLSDKEGINTSFFINNRTIYVGYKRPYFCRVDKDGNIDTVISSQVFDFQYGKTSHEDININYGGLFDITKSVGKETPITKLFAYGASRNLNRYYCADKITSGRYVNRLMLPSFSTDGKTDFIISDEGVERYGIREGSKQFEDIYPSIRYVTYGDLRKIKYCIKVHSNGVVGESVENSSFPVARVQCYKIVESETQGVNMLLEAAPDKDLVVIIHSYDKVVKVRLYGGNDALNKQLAADGKVVPTRTAGGNDYIPGSCFAVHDRNFDSPETTYVFPDRASWFSNPNEFTSLGYTEDQIDEIEMSQINYTDTFWLTDLYVYEGKNQSYFNREGYSAWAWPRLNNNYVSPKGDVASDGIAINEIVAVEPIVVDDTSLTENNLDKRQSTFDIYIRDTGFKIDEQNDFGEMVFVLNGALKVSMLDGLLAGREFEVPNITNDYSSSCICVYNDDGTINNDFFEASDYTDSNIPIDAYNNGAIWRLRVKREELGEDMSNLNIAMPTKDIIAKAGDHFVLLDITMPDIYIQIAEQRLLRESRKYLNANDRGKLNYSVNFDKVRMQQIPAYALQVREGLNVRLKDSDLDISTNNRVQKIYDGNQTDRTSMYETTYDDIHTERYTYDEYQLREHGYIEENLFEFNDVEIEDGERFTFDMPGRFEFEGFNDKKYAGKFYAKILESDYELCKNNSNKSIVAADDKIKIRLYRAKTTLEYFEGSTQFVTRYYPSDEYLTLSTSNTYIEKNADGTCWLNGDYTLTTEKKIENDYLDAESHISYVAYGVFEYSIKTTYEVDYNVYTPNFHLLAAGRQLFAPSKTLLEFTSGKHYEIVMQATKTNLLVKGNGVPRLALLNTLDDDCYYLPECSVVEEKIDDIWVQYEFNFDLKNFNDSQDYYTSLVYLSDNKTEYVETKLISVIESDEEGIGDLPYADFILDSVTIKVYDNSNRVDSIPIKEISATLSEQQNASAWATLMSTVDDVRIEGEYNSQLVENIVNVARKNYRGLLALKDSIFDPDGTCDQTFLQIMMMQVGADSMNFQLEKTKVDVYGSLYNCAISEDNVLSLHSDKLNHFVYTDGIQGGSWTIQKDVSVALTEPIYYIAIKCTKNNTDAEWVVDTVQHKVNEDDNCWYFNWGIVTSDDSSNYSIQETRGNAYMYGDNLICGRISTLAKQSYFDLNNGDFVLGKDGQKAFSYENGILTINGYPSMKDVSSVIETLNVLGTKINSIGGNNLLSESRYTYEYVSSNYIGYTKIANVESGQMYIATYEENSCSGEVKSEWVRGICLVVVNKDTGEEKAYKFNESFIASEGELYIAWGDFDYVDYILKDPSASEPVGSDLTVSVDRIMLQKGMVATSYQDSYKYLTDSMQNGSTDISGGLIVTTLINLKNSNGDVTAGISGYDDNQTDISRGVTLWSGGDYSDALKQSYISRYNNDNVNPVSILTGDAAESISKVLPILLTKEGIGSNIGCLEVVSSSQVAIYSRNRKSRILLSSEDDGGSLSIRLQKLNDLGAYVDRITISDEDVSRSILSTVLYGNPDVTIVKQAGVGMLSDTVMKETVVLNSDGWVCNMNSGYFARLIFEIRTGTEIVNGFKIVSGSFYFKKKNDSKVLSIDISNLEASKIEKNKVTFDIPLMDSSGLTFSSGEYYFGVNIVQFERLNSVNVSYRETPPNNRYTNGVIRFSLLQNISFTKNNDNEPSIIKVGYNGIKVSKSSSSNFIVRNDDAENITWIVNGLPSSDGVKDSPAGTVYNSGGYLMVK